MYGKWIDIQLGENIECKVFVWCNPDTPEYELKNQAMRQLKQELSNKQGIMGLGESIKAINAITKRG